MASPYSYPTIPDFGRLTEQLTEYARLQSEYGAKGVQEILDGCQAALDRATADLRALPIDRALAAQEPNDLASIHALRPAGPRRIWEAIPESFEDKLAGALYARMAGCTLGAIVEFWPVSEMEDWAAHIGDAFPPVDYWSRARRENERRYERSRCIEYTRNGMDGVPVDDDITYTQLGLLIAEDFGLDFSVEDVGKAWLRYLPYACTAEDVALKNLKAGVPAAQAADVNNPYCQWIGADIRSDPWAYMAPALPELAARMAHTDACLSHRRNGIYGEMFFAAAQAAAFAVSEPLEAIRIGLTEIPKDCMLAKDVEWALSVCHQIHGYRQARAAVDERFRGQSGVHTNLNACLVILGLSIGGTDLTRVLSEIVAMGQDNDCTAATAGSIVGAIIGFARIPPHWYARFNNRCLSYLIGQEAFAIDDLLRRFLAQAHNAFARI